jgi:uncharacterized protein (TIGR00369 family)
VEARPFILVSNAASSAESTVPEGFVPAPIGGAFALHNGPLYARWRDAKLELGFRVGPLHVNPGQACHGGMLLMFADILISTAAQYQADIPRQFLPTISLQTDFLAPALLGSWVQGRTDILRVTKRLVFSQGLIEADGELVMRASGVFRRGPLLPDSASDDTLRLPGMPPKSTPPRS